MEPGRPTAAGLVKDRDCPGRKEECHGQNMENVFLERGEPERGPYRVTIRLEDLGSESPPILVMLGARVGPKTYQVELELVRPEQEEVLVFEL